MSKSSLQFLIITLIAGFLYGAVLLVGAGLLTGGGHGNLALVALALGPIAHALMLLGGGLLVAILAILSWPAVVYLLVRGFKRCFLVVMVFYYLSLVVNWVNLFLDSPHYFLTLRSSLNLVFVGVYIGFFLCGQVFVWILYHRLTRKAQIALTIRQH